VKCRYLVNRIEELTVSGTFDREKRLPTLTALSHKFGASPVTVLKALKTLEAKGLIHSTRGGRFSTGREEPATRNTEHDILFHRTSAQIVSDAIRESVLATGTGGPLPSAKELAARHGCSHRTVRTALLSLVNDGVVRRRGAGYHAVVPGTKPSGHTSVYLVGTPSVLESAVGMGFVMGMERELEARQWGGLRYLTGDDPDRCTAPEDHLVAAYVHFCPDAYSSWATFLRRHAAIPAVMVNMHEVANQEPGSGRNIVTIMPDNRRAGREVALHCAANGHARCAFFSDITIEEGCAFLRLEGFTEMFRRQPAAAQRTCVVFEHSPMTAGADPRTNELNDTIDRVVESARRSSSLSPAFIHDGFYGAYGVLHWWNRFAALRPMFEEAYADRSITAWVCSHDPLAVLAHTFLAQKGAFAGREILLASFDNTQMSYSLGITSYDFGFDVMGRTAAYCLAAPHLVSIDKTNSVHLAGQLVARASSGRSGKG
jgi:DNA-binding LacI/PurR family transcriptional regulator/DNA-binding transcriptional regulator YhcF (GntR family)